MTSKLSLITSFVDLCILIFTTVIFLLELFSENTDLSNAFLSKKLNCCSYSPREKTGLESCYGYSTNSLSHHFIKALKLREENKPEKKKKVCAAFFLHCAIKVQKSSG